MSKHYVPSHCDVMAAKSNGMTDMQIIALCKEAAVRVDLILMRLVRS